MAEAMLVNAARAQHVCEVIRPALAARKVVLCDRFVDSTLAYQGYGRGLDLAALRAICEIAAVGLEPDLALVLDVPTEVAFARLAQRSKTRDRIEDEGVAFHERVREGFLELARGSSRHRVIDGQKSPELTLQTAMDEVRSRFGERVT
jgi:dTMP kinase